MKQYLQSGVVIFAGILGVAAGSASADRDPAPAPAQQKSDIREAILRRFLRESRLPIETYAETFIQEADAYQLDWRLLPSLAIVESGGGVRSRANNFFGWDNGAKRFSSATEAIHHVARALAGARPYKGKDLVGKLAAYNRTPGYRALVIAVMRQIAPSAVPEFGL